MSAVELARALRESLLDTIIVVVPLLAGAFVPTSFCAQEGDYYGTPSQTLQRSMSPRRCEQWLLRNEPGFIPLRNAQVIR